MSVTTPIETAHVAATALAENPEIVLPTTEPQSPELSDLELLNLAFDLGSPMTVDLEEVIVTGAVAENVDAPLAEESAPASMTTAKPEAAPAFDFNPVLPQYLTGALATPAETSTSAGKATRIPAGWTFSGRIVSNGDVDIGCRVGGSITCLNPKSSVFLRAESSTVGDVKADSINVEGTLTGRIDGSNGSVTLAKSSKIEGEVRYSNIQMHGGVHRMKLEYVEPTMA